MYKRIKLFIQDKLDTFSELVNSTVGEGCIAIADKKVLNGMIARYMNSFDKFGMVSNKYNGIWY